MKKWIREREEGQGLVEYALVLVLVAVVVILILAILGDSVIVTYARVMGGFNGQTVTMTGNEAILIGLSDQQSQNGSSGICSYTITANAIVGLSDGNLVKDQTVSVNVLVGSQTVSFSTNVGSSGVGTLTGSQSATAPCGSSVIVQ